MRENPTELISEPLIDSHTIALTKALIEIQKFPDDVS